MVAVAPMNLHSFVNHKVEHFGGEYLHEGTLHRELLHSFEQPLRSIGSFPGKPTQLRLDISHHAIYHAFVRVNPNRHLGELLLDQSELCDRFAKCLAFSRVANGSCQYVASSAVRKYAKLQSPDVQNVKRDNMAAADLAQDVFDGHLEVVEIHCRSRAALQPHLFFFGPGRYSGPLPLYKKGSEFLAAH